MSRTSVRCRAFPLAAAALLMTGCLDLDVPNVPSGGGVGPTLTIHSPQEGDTISLSVRDTGVGMPPGFDWMECQNLGLRLVRILVEQLNGTIDLQPEEKGTRFFIRVKKVRGSDDFGR